MALQKSLLAQEEEVPKDLAVLYYSYVKSQLYAVLKDHFPPKSQFSTINFQL